MDILTTAIWLSTLAEAAPAGGGLFPLPSHILWAIVNFAIIYWVLKKFLWKPLLKLLSDREAEVKGNLAKAAADRTEADRLRREFTEQVTTAQREAQDIVAQASRNAQSEAERIVTEARERAAAEWERAQKQISLEKDRALAELRQEVADLAVAVAGKVIERSLTDADHARLASSFVDEVGAN